MRLDLVASAKIESKIYLIRGKKVMVDRDLAKLYGVMTRNLNKAVKRNMGRFPDDFMFQLTKEEMKNWMFQFGTSKSERIGLRKRPYVFTQEGVAMLSSVLNSHSAIQVNIQIMRIFTKLREMVFSHKDLERKIEEMEKKYDHQFLVVFDAIKRLLRAPKEKFIAIEGFTKSH